MVELIKKLIAQRSAEWLDEDKLSFLWGEDVIIAYVRPDFNSWYYIIPMAPETEKETDVWIRAYLQTLDTEPDGGQ
jgi:hypothetical protein